jgi:hypothetical protein
VIADGKTLRNQYLPINSARGTTFLNYQFPPLLFWWRSFVLLCFSRSHFASICGSDWRALTANGADIENHWNVFECDAVDAIAMFACA